MKADFRERKAAPGGRAQTPEPDRSNPLLFSNYNMNHRLIL